MSLPNEQLRFSIPLMMLEKNFEALINHHIEVSSIGLMHYERGAAALKGFRPGKAENGEEAETQ
jgi:hypothetical protein